MSVLKIKTNGQWHDLAGVSSHTHSKNEITDFPTSLPANGGNADTVDGLHASDFVKASDIEKMIQNQIDGKVNKTVIDGELSEDSENPVQNKVISAAIAELNDLIGDSSVDDQINTYLKPGGIEKYALATELKDKAASDHIHNYAGSSSAGGAANSVKDNLTVKLNGGTTEGTNLFTYNGSTAKTVNITPSAIGAATSSHGNHVPTTETANNAKFLRNDNTWQTVTPANIGAAATDHGTHVSYSTTVPVMDGTASAGSATTVARSDHKHPTDTSRAAASELTKLQGLVGDTNVSTQIEDAIKKITHPVTSVNNKTGVVTLAASDVGAVPTTRTVNGKALSSNITLSASDIGAADSSHGTHVTFGTDTPKASGTASAGTATTVARSDHVHPAQINISGNAATATKATQDANGNVITSTYATKGELGTVSGLIGDKTVEKQIEDAVADLVSTVTTTGSGNAITQISKNGNTITAAKDGSFLVSDIVSNRIVEDAELTHGGTFQAIQSARVAENKLNTNLRTFVLPTETELSMGATSGSGNAVTEISVSGHTITLNKGDTFSKSDHGHSVATINADGFMSSTDKIMLNELSTLVGDSSVEAQINAKLENFTPNVTTNITTYTDPSQFGCTFASTLTEVCNAIPNNSIFLCNAGGFTDVSWNLPSTYGTILSFKINNSRNILHFYGKDFSVGNYQMGFSGSNEPTGVWTCDLSSVLSSSMYGTQLPGEDGKPYTHVKGRLFFLKASD